MKIAKRAIALLLCFCLIFLCCACGGKENESEAETEKTTDISAESEENGKAGDGKIVLPYNEVDGLNPYFAKSDENLYLCDLLYEPLYQLDKEFSATGVIAESIHVTDNVATVRLRSGVACRGSSDINAEDVVYSFNMAKASYGWSNTLKNVVSAEAVGQYAVDFILEYKDIYVAGKLDFPVVKVGTADVADAVPTGSGDYYYSERKLINVLNSEKKIMLSPIGNRESAENAFNIGETDVFFSNLSNCDYTVMAGKTQDVVLSNMVYLGLNSARGALTNYIRNAIAAKLDSDKISLSAYQGHGVGAKLPIIPESSLNDEVTSIDTKGNTTLANNIIDRCGYTRYSGKAKTNGAYTLSLSLMVNKDNKYRVAAAYNIADSLGECGFLITVQAVSFKEYEQRIENGNYDMYLGEIKLDGTMDISQFFNDNSPLSSGIATSGLVAREYYRYRAGEITPAEYYDLFTEYYPFIPILFRTGYVSTSGDLDLKLKQMPFSLYNNL